MAIQNEPSRISTPFADAGTKNVIPETMAQPSATAAASWQAGFPTVCSLPLSAGGIPPARNDFNGLFNQLSQTSRFLQDGGVFAWDASTDYGTNRLVLGSDGNLYWSVAQSGPNAGGAQNPVADNGTYWQAPNAKTMGLLEKSSAIATTEWVVDVFGDTTFYIDPSSGDDAKDGRSHASAIKTIGHAVGLANLYNLNKYTIVLHAGTYNENVVLTQQNVVLELHGDATISGNLVVTEGSVLKISDNGDGYALTVSTGSSRYVVCVVEQSFLISIAPINIIDTGIGSGVESCFAVSNSSAIWTDANAPITITATNLSAEAFLVAASSAAILGGSVTITGTSANGGVYAERTSEVFFYNLLTINDILSAGYAFFARCGANITISYTKAVIHGSPQQWINTICALDSSSIFFTNSELQFYTKGLHQYTLGSNQNSAITLSNCDVEFISNSVIGGVLSASTCSAINIYGGNLSFSCEVETATADANLNGCIYVFGGAVSTGTVTGKRYSALTGGQINVSGAGANFFPGTIAGTVDSASFGYYS